MIEIFNAINNRMIKAVMFHEQMADYFDYLNLCGLKRQQEYRYLKESVELRGLHRYAINHCNKLIQEDIVENPRAIPSNWYNYTRLQVDNATRKNAIKEAFEKWYAWESETKDFYQKQFKILTDNSKIADANKVNELICGVDKELKYLTRQMLEYKSVDYDLNYIMYQQDEMHEKYDKMTKEIGVTIC